VSFSHRFRFGLSVDSLMSRAPAFFGPRSGTVMLCLDPADRGRGNRASVGQILDLLNDAELAGAFSESAASAGAAASALTCARALYTDVIQRDAFKRGRALRNDAISHVLVRDEPTPTVDYQTVYELQDAAERLVTDLYAACCRGYPQFHEHEARLAHLASTFWDTYFAGMAANRER
jgi:hypothetical protein